MPALKNDRHERFAQGLAKGLSADEAYREAGYKPNRGNAIRLKANENVLKRLSELQEQNARKTAVTVQSLTEELEEARGLALSEKQSSAAVSATMGKAKLHGFAVEKRHHSGTVALVTITPDQLKELSQDELARLDAALPVLEKLGLVGGDRGGETEAVG